MGWGSCDYIEPADTTDAKYPSSLITSWLVRYFYAHTRADRIPLLTDVATGNLVEIHPDEAALLDIAESGKFAVSSRRSPIVGAAWITDSVPTGVIYMNMHNGSVLWVGDGKQVNLVTNPVYDIHSNQPEFKYCAVRITKASPREEKGFKEPESKKGKIDATQQTIRFFETMLQASETHPDLALMDLRLWREDGWCSSCGTHPTSVWHPGDLSHRSNRRDRPAECKDQGTLRPCRQTGN